MKEIANHKSKITIVGGGPAGSSLAIRLAQNGFETVLVERERFPRQKLCGEFISPECFEHFRELGVLDRMLAAGGERIGETRFYETGGRCVVVPTDWFGGGDTALSMSRAAMDHLLLERAKEVGVSVVEGTTVNRVEFQDERAVKIVGRSDDSLTLEIESDLFVDATGRAATLGKLARRGSDEKAGHNGKPAFVGFKAHIPNVLLTNGVCEIYSFPGGYAGLSNIENDLANLCFLIRSETVRAVDGGADEIVKRVVLRNKRAFETLADISTDIDWLAVSINAFGSKTLTPASNIFSIGDAAAFIDPFTGSGMVMAFESARLFTEVVSSNEASPGIISERYRREYKQRFSMRLRVCSVLRRTAFMPRLASSIVWALGVNSTARRVLARATRH